MDVTPQVINEVEFHQKMRGYDPDEVDDFLERIAVAVGQLQDRAHEYEARSATAERRALELERRARELAEQQPAAAEDDTETIRRTLVLAQRTADAAVKEAQEEAQRTLSGAQEHADVLLSEAQATSRRLVTEAEVEARKASDDTRQRMVAEIIALEEARDALKADQGILERHLEEQRLRLRSAIGDLQRLLDDPARLRVASAPELSGAARPSFLDDQAPAPEAGDAEDASDADDGGVIDLDDASEEDDDAEVSVAVEAERPITGGVRFTPAEDSGASPEASRGRTAVAMQDDGDSDAWSRFVREEMLDRPTAAVSTTGGEDAYLSELRKAMLEDTSAPGSDEHQARTRFGRRR
jgi:DivIVA domain-containing protein